jgi:hypothetical protein
MSDVATVEPGLKFVLWDSQSTPSSPAEPDCGDRPLPDLPPDADLGQLEALGDLGDRQQRRPGLEMSAHDSSRYGTDWAFS